MHTIKRLKNQTITVILVVALALSCLFGAIPLPRSAAAHAEGDTVEFATTSLGISNPHFDTSSGSYPATPSSWTGAAAGGSSADAIVSGVVDLSNAYFSSGSGNKEFKLDQYPEYKDDSSKPKTIFGANTIYSGSDEKALLINTKPGAEAAYAYSSSDMTFAANSFYRVSVWVKTGNFAADTGATIKLTGLGENLSFMNINTVKDIAKKDGIPDLESDNGFYGWDKYMFYVRTSASYSRTVKLVLGLGDATTGSNEDSKDVVARPAKGYAFFDTVTAEQISAHVYATETRTFTNDENADRKNLYFDGTGRSVALDLYELDNFVVDGKDLGTFSDTDTLSLKSGANAWVGGVYYDEYSDNNTSVGVAHSIIYDSENIIRDLDSDNNIYGFTKNPWAPLGRAEYNDVISLDGNYKFGGDNANILLISTYDGTSFQRAAYGVASPTVKIERYKYYRFSVWVKGDSIDGSAGISLLVKGKRQGATNDRKLGEYSGWSGDDSNTSHYGWKEQTVYIKGSMLYDYDVRFELWLGTPASKAAGIAMFDNVTFTELSYTQYSGMSTADSGNFLSNIDAEPADTGITNGNFFYIDDYEGDLEFPMPVADWTFLTPESVEIPNGSNVKTDVATHGLIPTDSKFDELCEDGILAPSVNIPSRADLTNILLISSATPTAVGYKSSLATVSSGSAYKFTVDMAVNGVTDGTGATLVLKNSSNSVLATIQNIKTTYNKFETFTFYVNAPLVGDTVYLEIWLGYGDTITASSKLSDGNVYIKSVGVSDWTAAENSSIESEYNALYNKYRDAVSSEAGLKSLNYAVFSFNAPSFDYYDVYSYGNGSLGTPYLWRVSAANANNVISGIFDPENLQGFNVYDGFESKGLTGNMLYIHNTQATRSTYSFANSITTEANKYYKLSMDVKVHVTDDIRNDKDSVGATLRLTGTTTAEIENIKNTTTVTSTNADGTKNVDYETFKTYSFIISTGENGGDIGLEIEFGGDSRKYYIEGKLIVANIRLEESDNLEFEEAEADEDNEYVKTVSLSTASDDETGDDSNTDDSTETKPSNAGIEWWILPTVIFSVALVAVIIIIIVVKIRDFIRKKRKVTYSTEYDRTDTIRDIERLQKQAEADKAAADKNVVPDLNATEHDELDEDAEITADADEETTDDAEATEKSEPEKAKAPEIKTDASTDLDD